MARLGMLRKIWVESAICFADIGSGKNLYPTAFRHQITQAWTSSYLYVSNPMSPWLGQVIARFDSSPYLPKCSLKKS